MAEVRPSMGNRRDPSYRQPSATYVIVFKDIISPKTSSLPLQQEKIQQPYVCV